MRRNPVYAFKDLGSIGISNVPLESMVQVTDIYDGELGSQPLVFQVLGKDGVGSSTTIAEFLEMGDNYIVPSDTTEVRSELEKITQGNVGSEKTGWRLLDVDPSLYGNIGEKAIDMSIAPEIPNGRTFGALGDISFASGDSTRAIGVGSSAQGIGTISQNRGQLSLGKYNTGTSTDTILEVGIGNTFDNGFNGLEVLTSGEVRMPSATEVVISAGDSRAITTKEYQETANALKVNKAGDTMTGDLIVNSANININKGTTGGNLTTQGDITAQGNIKTGSDGVSKSVVQFGMGGQEFYWDSLNAEFRVKTTNAPGSEYRVWHAGNQGSGSGMNADLLDGFDSLDLPISVPNQTALDLKYDKAGGIISGDVTVQSNLTAGGDTTLQSDVYLSGDVVTDVNFTQNITTQGSIDVLNTVSALTHKVNVGGKLAFTGGAFAEPTIYWSEAQGTFVVDTGLGLGQIIWHTGTFNPDNKYDKTGGPITGNVDITGSLTSSNTLGVVGVATLGSLNTTTINATDVTSTGKVSSVELAVSGDIALNGNVISRINCTNDIIASGTVNAQGGIKVGVTATNSVIEFTDDISTNAPAFFWNGVEDLFKVDTVAGTNYTVWHEGTLDINDTSVIPKEFNHLNDTPVDKVGQAGRYVVVNATEDALEYIDAPEHTPSWGNIIGTLASQIDLQNALDDKFNNTGGIIDGDVNINGDTIMGGYLDVNGTFNAKADANFTGSVIVSSDVNIQGNLVVDGTSTFQQQTTFTLDTTTNGNATILGNLNVGSAATPMVLTVAGDETVSNDLSVGGILTTTGVSNLSGTNVTGALNVTGDTVITGNTTVIGNTSIAGNATVAGLGNTFTIDTFATGEQVATLDITTNKLRLDQLPQIAITSVQVVNTIADRDTLTNVQEGDVVKVVDTIGDGSNVPSTYILAGDGSWVDIQETSDVISVAGKTGTVLLNTDDVTEAGNLYYTDARADARVLIETTRATTAEGVNALAISDEETRATTAEGINALAISDEETRATTAEGVNALAISDETTRATTAEGVNALAISDEETRATTAEGINALAISDETTRATTAEGINALAISDEETRATTAEGINALAISDETTRATTAEGSLDTRLTTAEGNIATNIADIITIETDVSDNTTAISGKEDSLGNPSNDGDILSSTIAGVRTWISNTVSGQVDSVVAGTNVQVDNTDPINPIISSTDTTYPVVTATTGGVLSDAQAIKFDGIETGATADMTGAEIATVLYAESDTNRYTDNEKSQLASISTTFRTDIDAVAGTTVVVTGVIFSIADVFINGALKRVTTDYAITDNGTDTTITFVASLAGGEWVHITGQNGI